MVQESDQIIEIDRDGDLIEADDEITVLRKADVTVTTAKAGRDYKTYIILPAIFLAVTLLGGMRLGAADNAFIFLKPALVCLVFAALTLVLYFRSGLITVDGWLSESLTGTQNAANAFVVLTLFTATVQLFNSLLPEQDVTVE